MSRTAASSRTALIPSLQTDVRIWNVMSDSAAPTIETRNDTTFALLVIFLAVLNTLKLREAFKKKRKKKYEIFHTWVCPPPYYEKFFDVFFF